MSVRKSISIACSVAVALTGCATASKDIATAYVTPFQYQSYDCGQLAAEIQRIQSRVTELGGRLDQAADNDKAIMGVGLLIFWPALFALGGTKQQEAEYSRIKGEYEALQQASISKNCRAGSISYPTAAIRNSTETIQIADVETKLTFLRDLRDKGVLTEAEFNQKRSEAIDLMLATRPSEKPKLSQVPNNGVAGLRFMIRDSDSMTKLTASESILAIDTISDRGTSLNGGITTLDASGKLLTGTISFPHIAGLGGGRLNPGFSTYATFTPNGAPPVEVKVVVRRLDVMRISNREITVAHCSVAGYTPQSQTYGTSQSWKNAPISGEITVEPLTGLTVAANVTSANPNYSINRSIVTASQ